MARIRTIKPQFWRDEKIAGLRNKMAGYFFIGLWNVADDEGKFPLNAKQLHLELPIFRTKDILTYISELSEKGLIVISQCSQWGLVVNWSHQKISRPVLPKVKSQEIQWLKKSHSLSKQESSVSKHRKDRIGKDSIGYSNEYRNLQAVPQKSETNAVAKAPAESFPVPKKSRYTDLTRHKMRSFIEQYAKLYKQKYSSSPEGIRDKGVIGKLGNWIETVSEDRANSLVQVFLQIDYRPINESYHDLWQFFRHLNRISHALDSGQDTATINWGKVFNS